MEFIKSYSLILTFTAFVAAISEMLLSGTVYRKYVKVVVGFVMIIAILSPIIKFTNQDISFQGYSSYAQDSADYKQEYQKAVTQKFHEDLSQKLKTELSKENITIDSCDFQFDENENSADYLKIFSLKISCKTALQDAVKIRNTVNSLFGLTDDKIQVTE